MNEILEGFLKAAEDETQGLNVASLMSDDEQSEWETLVQAMDSIDILHIGKDLEHINKKYPLERWQELSILAYVKVLELMMLKLKEAEGSMGLNLDEMPSVEPKTDIYTGSMFG